MAYIYKVAGQTVALEIDPTVVAVRFRSDQPSSARARAAEAAGTGPFAARFDIPEEGLTIVPVGPAVTGARAASVPETVVSALNAQPQVSNAFPVFRVSGNQVVATDRVIIGLNDLSRKDAIVTKFNLSLIGERDDKIICRIPEGSDVFAIVAAVESESDVRFIEPDFVTVGRHIPKRVAAASTPILSDPMVDSQYAMKIVRATEAWELQSGHRDVKIAILDEGVDSRHADLAEAVTGTYDALDDDTYQEPNGWDGHGTACAGLAAAIGGNQLGIRGAGAGCSLMCVRIARSAHRNGPWITTNEAIARGIAWSWKNGADVLSNSWSGGAPSNDIAEEFEKAGRLGRGGRGCVVVIAAGNDFGPVPFPGTLAGALTVSASNEYDEAKTPTSRDGENWWGTNHGPAVGVAAPGVHNLTTDISGAHGYAGGDYEPKFNGTSSATPIVAGACGLVLSANPGLTAAQVRSIITGSADKVGPYPYVAGRNDFFGQGRLNVLAAVRAAQASSSGA